MFVKITDKNGRPIDDATPFPVKLIDANGNAIATDEDGNLLVKQTGSNALYSGLKTVTAAGTRTVLNSDQACREVLIVARKSNTGSIYVGGAAVSSTNYGVELVAGESVRLPVSNLNLIYIDSSVSGEGVSYVAI